MNESCPAVSKLTVESFIWRDVCRGWTLLDAPRLHVLQERMPAGTRELPHLHECTHQLYFILEGQATVGLQGTDVKLEPGQALEIPNQTPHQMRNESDSEIEFLVISSQRPREDRIDL